MNELLDRGGDDQRHEREKESRERKLANRRGKDDNEMIDILKRM